MATYGEAPTHIWTIREYGVEAAGTILRHPFAPYDSEVERKKRLLLIARIALPAGAFFAWRVRRFLSEL